MRPRYYHRGLASRAKLPHFADYGQNRKSGRLDKQECFP